MSHFLTKNPNLCKFRRVLQRKMFVYFMVIGLFHVHLLYFMVIESFFPVLVYCTKKNLAILAESLTRLLQSCNKSCFTAPVAFCQAQLSLLFDVFSSKTFCSTSFCSTSFCFTSFCSMYCILLDTIFSA
jgi:hypothetical protein